MNEERNLVMRIIFFRLKGYIKVLNGMGLDEIVIPFDQFQNRIILIQGENGCSKSTIISALSPNPDTSDDFRTDVYIDQNAQRHIIEYPAEKEIHYTDGSNIYKILIQSIVNEARTQRTTKAYISQNDIELNPNGNVSSFKDIRNNLLGIDPVYLDLSSIGAENRGIVDMIPSERRKYMASYVGSLETYNNIFKIVSKKANSFKSYIDILNSKILEIGNENELRLQLSQFKHQLQNLSKQRDISIKQCAEEELNIRLLDPENKNQLLFTSLSEQLETINSQIRQNATLLDKVYTQFASNTDLSALKSKLEDQLHILQNQLINKKNDISTNIALNNSLSSSIESDKNMLYGLQSNMLQTNVEETITKLNEKVKMYKSYLSENDIYILNQISTDSLNDLLESLDVFICDMLVIEERYDQSIYEEAIHDVFDGYKDLSNLIDASKQKMNDLNIKISETSYQLEYLTNEYELVLECKNSRPKECTIENCPYIAKYVLLDCQHNFEQEIDELQIQLDTYQSKCQSILNQIDRYTKVDDLVKHISHSINTLMTQRRLIEKIPELKSILDNSYLKEKLLIMYKFPEFNVVSTLIEKSGLYIELKQIEEQLKELNQNLTLYQNNLSLVESLTSSIEKNEKTYNNRIQQNRQLSIELDDIQNSISFMEDQIHLLTDSIKIQSDYDNLIKEKEQLELQFQSIEDNIHQIQIKQTNVENFNNQIKSLESQIEPIQDDINRLTYLLTNIVDYKHELKDYSDRYDKMTFIRNACSPGNGMGIQSEYVKLYMNNIICDCNQLLQYMFNGDIKLMVPVINEKQFSIPFIGPNGIIVPDISNGSTAQKCMIGLVFACIAMVRSSTKYNIPRFDEIDGGLDQHNRITFINVLNQVLDFMECEQCIICSHNTEFDTQNTTRLICSKNGITIEQ